MTVVEVETLAIYHWEYVESVLLSHGESAEVIRKCGFHYQTAFVHGWKHAMEAKCSAGTVSTMALRADTIDRLIMAARKDEKPGQ